MQRFERLVALNQESIRLTQARVREGDAAQLETQLLAVDLSRAEAERVTALGQLDAFLIELKQLVGISPSEQLVLAQLVRITTLPGVRELQSRASAERSDLRLARLLEQQGRGCTANIWSAELQLK